MELLVRWSCRCVTPRDHCSHCKGAGYLDRWIPRDLLRAVMGNSDFLIIGRRRGQRHRRERPVPAAEPRRQRATGSTLFVDGLPATFKNEQLREIFATAGTVVWSRIVMDANARCSGFGYVDMETPDDAARAAKALDGYKVTDGLLAVMISNRAPQALQAERFLELNMGKAFCELCIRSHIVGERTSSMELLDAFSFLYECSRFTGCCFECAKTTQVFAASPHSPTQK